MPKKKYPVEELADRTRYRYGDRDAAARAEHAAQSTGWRRDVRLAEFSVAEDEFLEFVAAGRPLREAAELTGLSVQAVHGRRQWDPSWDERLSAAQMRGRDPELNHGTEEAYKRCLTRCPACRAAHNRMRRGSLGGSGSPERMM